MNRVDIDRLEIRLRGTSADAVRSVSTLLGPELVRRLAREGVLSASGKAPAIDRLDVDAGRVPRHSTGRELSSALARQITAAIAVSREGV